MELFKFNYATDPTILERGEVINGITHTLWVERYREPGEFEISAPLSAGLREFLPTGTLISHSNTMEVMIVENHEIKDAKTDSPQLIITGRTLESYLENRIVGTNLARASNSVVDYTILADFSWNQAVQLINEHISTPYDPNDALGNIVAQTTLVPGPGFSVDRSVGRVDVLAALQELLAVDDLGIRTIRRNTFGIGSSTQTLLSIYKGFDRSASVILSWEGGDLETVEYLFSEKANKNSALVFGRYVYIVVDTGPVTYNRRMMIIDATDLDGYLNAEPVGTARTGILNKMTTRGQQALSRKNTITITQTDVSKTTQYQYRRDYDLGDLVSLDGNYGAIAVMRVTEYAEIEDENGESGHPTLGLPGG